MNQDAVQMTGNDFKMHKSMAAKERCTEWHTFSFTYLRLFDLYKHFLMLRSKGG